MQCGRTITLSSIKTPSKQVFGLVDENQQSCRKESITRQVSSLLTPRTLNFENIDRPTVISLTTSYSNMCTGVDNHQAIPISDSVYSQLKDFVNDIDGHLYLSKEEMISEEHDHKCGKDDNGLLPLNPLISRIHDSLQYFYLKHDVFKKTDVTYTDIRQKLKLDHLVVSPTFRIRLVEGNSHGECLLEHVTFSRDRERRPHEILKKTLLECFRKLKCGNVSREKNVESILMKMQHEEEGKCYFQQTAWKHIVDNNIKQKEIKIPVNDILQRKRRKTLLKITKLYFDNLNGSIMTACSDLGRHTYSVPQTCTVYMLHSVGIPSIQDPRKMSLSDRPQVFNSAMCREIDRYGSFEDWPNTSGGWPLRLAAAGFYHSGDEDEVICYSCGVRRRGWRVGMVPMDIHRSSSPNCQFVSCQAGNIPVVAEERARQRLLVISEINVNPSLPYQSSGYFSLPVETQNHEMSVPQDGSQMPGLTTADAHFPREEAVITPVQPALSGRPEYHTMPAQFSTRTPDVRQTTDRNPRNTTQPSNMPFPASGSNHMGLVPPQTQAPFNESINDTTQHLPTSLHQLTSGLHQSMTGQINSVPHPNTSTVTSNQYTSGSNIHSPAPNEFMASPNELTTANAANMRSTTMMQGTLGINTDQPQHPDYAVTATRVNSFNSGWPGGTSQTPHELAEAGFFYSGHADSVRCFFCGTGLRSWEEGDNPWIEHARWAPQCAYLNQHQGKAFVSLVHELSNGGSQVNYNQVLDILKDMPGETTPAIQREALDTPPDSVSETASSNNRQADVSDRNSPSIANNDGEDSLQEENERLKQQQLCKICLDNEVTIVFLPCGHLVSCAECAPALRKCPMCRAPVRGTVRAYMS